MSVLEIKNLSHRFDDRELFIKANLTINNGEHVGIVGLNGAGKSTFINIIAQRIPQDEGEVLWLPNIRRGYLDQHAVIDKTLTAMEYLLTAFEHLREKEQRLNELYDKMSTADSDELEVLIKRSSRLQEELDDEGYYDLEARIKKVGNGLGVNKFGYDAVIGKLSGGERAKLMLSKLLLEQPDIMLLDEPTNFLDVEHVDWLTKYLNTYKKTFMVISHDTAFLNAVCRFVVNIENGTIKKYSGNYDNFTKIREMNAKQYEEEYRKQQSEVKKLQDYIDRNKARAATAGMANARKKMLDKIELIAKPVTVYEAQFDFPYEEVNSKEFLVVEKLSVGYSRELIPPIDFVMKSDTKLWIRGTNGVGKSTLVKTLLRKIPKLGGSFYFHQAAKPIYLEQELGFGEANYTAGQYFSECFPRLNSKEVRSSLAKVGIKGDLAIKPMKNLSGGEQVRVKLAVLTKRASNILILDEPTNHLDVIAKKALMTALQEYKGAIILVSHETEFAEAVCDKVFDARPD